MMIPDEVLRIAKTPEWAAWSKREFEQTYRCETNPCSLVESCKGTNNAPVSMHDYEIDTETPLQTVRALGLVWLPTLDDLLDWFTARKIIARLVGHGNLNDQCGIVVQVKPLKLQATGKTLLAALMRLALLVSKEADHD